MSKTPPPPEKIEMVPGYTKKVKFGCGTIYINMDELDGQPLRLFLKLGKAGICQRALLESLGRVITIIMQESPELLPRICKTLKGVRCDQGTVGRQSCVDVVARDIEAYLPETE